MLIAVPLLALIAFAALGYAALQRSTVRGDEYKALKQAQDLRAAVVPPPASLLEAWATVNHIAVIAATTDGFSAANRTAIERDFVAIASAKEQFESSMEFWSQQGLDQRVEIRLLQIGGWTGTRFFEVIEEELKPAVEAKDVQQVIEVVRSMEWRFELQQTGVARALVWAESEVNFREVGTSNYVDEIIIYAEEESERIEREGEPEEMQDPPEAEAAAEEAQADGSESAASEEAVALAEGEVPAEPIADAPAPAGGFESLFQPAAENASTEVSPASPADDSATEAEKPPKTEADG